MIALAYIGVLMVVAGMAGLGYCIRAGIRIRTEKPAPEVARARLQKLVAVNLGSVAAAALGLGMVVMGLTL